MNWTDLLSALALVLVLEGLLPFISPDGWQAMLKKILETPPSSLRVMGLVMIAIGLLMLYLVRG